MPEINSLNTKTITSETPVVPTIDAPKIENNFNRNDEFKKNESLVNSDGSIDLSVFLEEESETLLMNDAETNNSISNKPKIVGNNQSIFFN